jgi:hypothetical protein
MMSGLDVPSGIDQRFDTVMQLAKADAGLRTH